MKLFWNSKTAYFPSDGFPIYISPLWYETGEKYFGPVDCFWVFRFPLLLFLVTRIPKFVPDTSGRIELVFQKFLLCLEVNNGYKFYRIKLYGYHNIRSLLWDQWWLPNQRVEVLCSHPLFTHLSWDNFQILTVRN